MTKNHFALLNIDESLSLNVATLKKAYFKAQQQCHPDRAKSDAEKLEFLQRSADVNQAYHTLKDFAPRLNYILKLRGTDIDGEHAPKAPPALLMESMEWREQWMECDDDAAKAEFKHMLNDKIDAQEKRASEAYTQNNMAAMVEAALALRYLSRMKEETARG